MMIVKMFVMSSNKLHLKNAVILFHLTPAAEYSARAGLSACPSNAVLIPQYIFLSAHQRLQAKHHWGMQFKCALQLQASAPLLMPRVMDAEKRAGGGGGGTWGKTQREGEKNMGA